jgi:hypothetical protein
MPAGAATVSCARSRGSIARGLCGAAVWSTVAAWSGKGEAQELPGVEMHWEAPAGCPGTADVESRVRRLLGSEAAQSPPSDRLVADATVLVVGGRYQLRLNVRQGGRALGGTRVFDSDSCASLAGAAAVTLALLARGEPRPSDVAASLSSGPTSAGPTAGTASPPASASTAPPPPAPPTATPTSGPAAAEKANATSGERSSTDGEGRRPGRGWSADVELPLLSMDDGVLPGLAYGLGASAGIRVSRVQAMLTGVLWLPQESGAAGSPYVVRYVRYTGELSGCYGWPLSRLEVGPCVLMRLEDVTGSGSGPEVVGQTGNSVWVGVGMAARARWSLNSWMALFARPSVTFATSHPTFAITEVGPLYRVPIAAVAFDIGSEWIF